MELNLQKKQKFINYKFITMEFKNNIIITRLLNKNLRQYPNTGWKYKLMCYNKLGYFKCLSGSVNIKIFIKMHTYYLQHTSHTHTAVLLYTKFASNGFVFWYLTYWMSVTHK